MHQIYLKLLCLLLTQIGKTELCPYPPPKPPSEIVVTDTTKVAVPLLSTTKQRFTINNKTETEEDIFWSANRKLTWDDFQASVDTTMPKIAALTYSSIIYRRRCEDKQLKSSIQAVFKKKRSWVKPNMRTDYHLDHEQLHFDITELYARKLRGALEKYVFDCGQVLEFNRVVSVVLKEWKNMEHKYDIETIYSQDMTMQSEWYVYIHLKLNDCRDYAMAK